MNKKNDDEQFIFKILVISALIILCVCLEAMFLAKDFNNYDKFSKAMGEVTYDEYVNMIIFNMLLKVLNPVVISLYTFFTRNKIKINNIYKMFFGFASFVSLLYIFLSFQLRSIFYYIEIILHIILLYFIVTKERT